MAHRRARHLTISGLLAASLVFSAAGAAGATPGRTTAGTAAAEAPSDKPVPTFEPGYLWSQPTATLPLRFPLTVNPAPAAGAVITARVDGQPDVDFPLDAAGTTQIELYLQPGIQAVQLSFAGDADLAPASIAKEFLVDTNDQAFVRQAFWAVLDRNPDQGAISFWTKRLANATSTPIGVVDGLANSKEARENLVREAFPQLLGRNVDPAGATYWANKLATGTTVEAMRSGLIASDEGYRKAGGTPPTYVAKLYTTVLGRSAGQSELDYWAKRVGPKPTRWDRQKAALTIGRSSEATRIAVRAAITKACGAAPASDAQRAQLAQRWTATGQNPLRLAGAALAWVCRP